MVYEYPLHRCGNIRHNFSKAAVTEGTIRLFFASQPPCTQAILGFANTRKQLTGQDVIPTLHTVLQETAPISAPIIS